MKRRSWFGGWGSAHGPSKEELAKQEAARLTREADIRRIYEAGTQKEVLCQLYKSEEVEKVIAKIDRERELLKLLEEEAAEQQESSEDEEEHEEDEAHRKGKDEPNEEHAKSEQPGRKDSSLDTGVEAAYTSALSREQEQEEDDGDELPKSDSENNDIGGPFASATSIDHDEAELEDSPTRRPSKFILRFGSGDEDEHQMQPRADVVRLESTEKSSKKYDSMDFSNSNMLDVGLDSVTNLSYHQGLGKDEVTEQGKNQRAGVQEQEDDLLKELMTDYSQDLDNNDFSESPVGSDINSMEEHRNKSEELTKHGFADESLREPPIVIETAITSSREQSGITVDSLSSDDEEQQEELEKRETTSPQNQPKSHESRQRLTEANGTAVTEKKASATGSVDQNDIEEIRENLVDVTIEDRSTSLQVDERGNRAFSASTTVETEERAGGSVDIGATYGGLRQDATEGKNSVEKPTDAMEAESDELIEEIIVSDGDPVQDEMDDVDVDQMETASIADDEEILEDQYDEEILEDQHYEGDLQEGDKQMKEGLASETMEVAADEVDEVVMDETVSEDEISDGESFSSEDVAPPPPPPLSSSSHSAEEQKHNQVEEVEVEQEFEENIDVQEHIHERDDGKAEDVVDTIGTEKEEEEVVEEEEGEEEEEEEVVEDDHSEHSEYADQIVESWHEIVDEQPDDLEAAVSALIAVVYKEGEVDMESMLRRTPLPELYKYLKAQYWYKIHTNQDEAADEAAKTVQETLSQIVSVDDMLKGRLQGLMKNVQASSRNLMGDQSSNAEDGSDGNLGYKERREKGLKSLINNIQLGHRAVMDEESKRRLKSNSAALGTESDEEEEEIEEDLLPPASGSKYKQKAYEEDYISEHDEISAPFEHEEEEVEEEEISGHEEIVESDSEIDEGIEC